MHRMSPAWGRAAPTLGAGWQPAIAPSAAREGAGFGPSWTRRSGHRERQDRRIVNADLGMMNAEIGASWTPW